MKRVVLDSLPFPDPATEARQIVWAGMSDIVYSLSDEERARLGPSPFPAILGGEQAKDVHVLVDEKRGVTFCSRQADATVRAYDHLLDSFRASLRFPTLPARDWTILNDVL